MSMEFKWCASDGYVGGNRPQSCRIDLDDLAECETEHDVADLVEEAVRDDFEQKVSPSWSDSEFEKVLAKWAELRESRGEPDDR